MFDIIFTYLSGILSVIGIIWCSIIFWQFVTGREYWGQARESLIGPNAFVTMIPMLNILYWFVVSLLYIGAWIIGTLIIFREKAVEKREKLKYDN